MARTIAEQVADYVLASDWSRLPASVQHESKRILLNWLGCTLSGATHPSLINAEAASMATAGSPQATIIGRRRRTDIVTATLLNGTSASAFAFDDTHLPTVAHPSAPTVAAMLALAEHRPMTGTQFLHALVISNELQCRLANALVVPPANVHVGFYMTGLTGAFGVAAAVGKLLGLDAGRLVHALGLAAAQASGFRATHASMASAFVPGNAGRSGLVAAQLAEHGFTCQPEILEGKNGFGAVYGTPANLTALTDKLGEHFECLAVAAKPYPAGVFIHPAIEACLELAKMDGVRADAIERVTLRVHPLGVGLTGRAAPKNAYEAQVSLFHWAAAALVRRVAGLAEADDACVTDPTVAALRERVTAEVDAGIGGDEAIATVHLRDGTERRVHVPHCVGSAAQPMSDASLERKFLDQARLVLEPARAERLIEECWGLAQSSDVGRAAPGVWG